MLGRSRVTAMGPLRPQLFIGFSKSHHIDPDQSRRGLASPRNRLRWVSARLWLVSAREALRRVPKLDGCRRVYRRPTTPRRSTLNGAHPFARESRRLRLDHTPQRSPSSGHAESIPTARDPSSHAPESPGVCSWGDRTRQAEGGPACEPEDGPKPRLRRTPAGGRSRSADRRSTHDSNQSDPPAAAARSAQRPNETRVRGAGRA